MANQESYADVEEFMNSPLVTWFNSCLEGIIKHKLTFEELVDGVLIYNVFLNMDIHGQINDVAPPNNDHVQRLENLETIMRNMRLFYEEDSVVLKEPNLRFIARAAHSNLQDVETLLILLLGCAVKCPNKKHFIERITLLDQTTQQVIASHIEKVMHFPDVVLSRDMLLIETTDLDEEEPEEPTFHTQKVYKAFEEVRRIYKERVELIERGESAPPPNIPHCLLELNEWKAKALQLKNVEDEYTHELQKYAERLEIIEKENVRLVSEAKAAKEYRDALDVAMEKVLKAERLEQEVTRYKEKLDHLESFKSRVLELKADNELLNENKEELVSQLNVYKAKVDKIMEVEAQMYKLKEQCDKLVLENDSLKKKTAELIDINEELEQRVKHSTASLQSSTFIARSDESLNTSFDNSICEQLSRSTNSEILRLELENRRLSKLVESLRESSFHESSFKILDLEKEKKSLELENEDLATKIKSLEETLASASKEKMQLRVLLENSQKFGNGEMESRVVALESEKRQVQRELENNQVLLKEKLAALEASSKIINELQAKLQKQRNQDSEDSGDDELNTSILKSPPRQTIVHNRLKNDLQRVTHERSVLKNQVREAQLKIKRQNEAIEKLEQRLQAPSSPDPYLEKEFENLKCDFNALVFKYRKAKHLAEELSKCHDEDKLEMRAKNARIIELDVQNSKLHHRCDLLKQLHEQTESDKVVLMDYVSQIMKQNQDLVAQTLEDKEHYHEEERKNNETLNNLSRAKEKLEEKIMDQYRRMNNRQVKKRSAAVAVVKNSIAKVRRAGSEFFGRSRKSWSDENSSATEKSDEFEFTRPSEIYANLPRNRKSIDFMHDFEPENFSFDEKNNNNSNC